MKIEFVILADAAEVAGGKLYLLGGAWNQYRCRAFPSPATMALVTSILVDWSEAGRRYPLTMTLADEAGVPVVPPVNGEVDIGRPPEGPEGPQRTVVALNAHVSLPRPGRYTFEVTAGTAKSTIIFDAVFVGKRVEIPSSGSGSGIGH
jgi:hypothetical protein